MALILVSGLPCSGRTTRAEELREALTDRLSGSSLRSVTVVSDTTAHNRRTCYATQRSEKPARAAYLSAVTRHLAPDTIVIADGGAGLNIKGFRYQLWCAAREEKVRSISVQVHAPPDKCREWNNARRAAGDDAYDPDTLDELLQRYEEPNNMTRWDQPLFVVPSVPVPVPGMEEDPHAQPDPVPVDYIWQAATQGAAVRAPGVVAPQQTTAGNYLTMLETATQAVVAALMERSQSLGLPEAGGKVALPIPLEAGVETTVSVDLPPLGRPLTLPALQRHRRTFVRMHSSGMASVNAVGDAARDEARDVSAGEREIARRFAAWLAQVL